MHDSTRLEAFSDAVFGFALTLLVVALEVPASFEDLTRAMRGFGAFAATFAVLYWIWYEHQRYFRRHPVADGHTIILNAFLLFVVLFYIYPLKFMFTFLAGFAGPAAGRVPVTLEQSRLLLVIYGLGFAAVFGIFGLMYTLAAARAERDGTATPDHLRHSRIIARSHALSVGIGLTSVALALVLPSFWIGFAGIFYALLGPVHAAHGFWSFRGTARAPGSGV